MGISNTQYRDIMFQYDQTRMNNQRILDKRYETLFAEIPELEQIQHDIMDLSLTQARKELFQTEPDPKSEAEYSAKREALLSRKKALLQVAEAVQGFRILQAEGETDAADWLREAELLTDQLLADDKNA